MFIRKLLKRIKIINTNSTSLFILIKTILKLINKDNFLLESNKIIIYRQIVKSVLYLLNNTRLNILYAIGQLARFILKPAAIYLQMYKQLLQYLANIIKVRITYLS
jgi:hypothetical protein